MDDSRRCRAMAKSTGERCRKAAILGGRTCPTHGSANKRARVAAARRRAETLARELMHDPDAVPVTDPVGALQRLAGQLQQALGTIGALADEHGAGSDLARVHVGVYVQLARELRQLLADMKRLGIAEQLVEIEAAKVKLVAIAFGRALDALELSFEQRETATRVLLTELRSEVVVEERRQRIRAVTSASEAGGFGDGDRGA